LGHGPDLIILHGLYGAGDNWLTVGRQLAAHFRVHLPDLRNHGNSPHETLQSYPAMVSDLVEYMADHRISTPIVMGHSMGGKTAMWLSILHPESVSKLIVVDISPAGYARMTSPSPVIGQHLNIIHAIRTVDLSTQDTRKAIDLELSAYIPDERVRQFLTKSIERGKDGVYRWKINVEAVSNSLPEIMQGIDIDKYAPAVNPAMPVLFIRGELSDYIPDEDIPEIKRLYPGASVETIFNAGHWIHAEKPEAFLSVVNHFLASGK
jgi:pimeloyl-ACP methyl ester carboxylesterase